MSKFKYSEAHIEFLAKGYKKKSIKDLTKAFNAKFNMNKTAVQIKSALSNRGIVAGRTGRFEKGNIPHNAMPLGSERTSSSHGYVFIKVAEKNPYSDAKTRYKYKHIHIWEQANGPVPEGYVVIFKDGDKKNFLQDNLILVSRKELLVLNQNNYKSTPREIKPSVMRLSKLQAKIGRKGKSNRSNTNKPCCLYKANRTPFINHNEAQGPT